MTAKGQNFEMYQGDNHVIVITVTGVLDLTGYNVVWCVHNQTLADIVFQKTTNPGEGIEITGPTEITITLSQDDTAHLSPKIYGHQCEIEDSLGHHSTITVGYMKLFRSITHTHF